MSPPPKLFHPLKRWSPEKLKSMEETTRHLNFEQYSRGNKKSSAVSSSCCTKWPNKTNPFELFLCVFQTGLSGWCTNWREIFALKIVKNQKKKNNQHFSSTTRSQLCRLCPPKYRLTMVKYIVVSVHKSYELYRKPDLGDRNADQNWNSTGRGDPNFHRINDNWYVRSRIDKSDTTQRRITVVHPVYVSDLQVRACVLL